MHRMTSKLIELIELAKEYDWKPIAEGPEYQKYLTMENKTIQITSEPTSYGYLHKLMDGDEVLMQEELRTYKPSEEMQEKFDLLLDYYTVRALRKTEANIRKQYDIVKLGFIGAPGKLNLSLIVIAYDNHQIGIRNRGKSWIAYMDGLYSEIEKEYKESEIELFVKRCLRKWKA